MNGTTVALLLMLGIPLGPLLGHGALRWWHTRQHQARRRKVAGPAPRRPMPVRSHVVAFARSRRSPGGQ
jgi:hypothetical protein